MNINQNYFNLKDSYLFSTIAEKVEDFTKRNPEKDVIRLGIGDVTLPLAPAVTDAMQNAVAEMGKAETFRGYRSDMGYDFLRHAVAGYYRKKGVALEETEIFISDGAKSDTGNILDIFGKDNVVLIPDPVYPVYVDTNIMSGNKIIYMNGNEENGFLPLPDYNIKCDIIYLCSPNNPSGAVYTKQQLKQWIDYALENEAVILFDSAYEAFVRGDDLPTSIYQVDGAKRCAVEVCSLSKTAGFTGTRCGYTIFPHDCKAGDVSLNRLWLRRQSTKFNGVSYIVQRGAEAVFTEEGMKQTRQNIDYYLDNAKRIAAALKERGIWFAGGENSPYIWFKCPKGMSSWEFFDHLLSESNIVGTPGAGFGKNGEGFFRLSAFGSRENVIRAMERLEI